MAMNSLIISGVAFSSSRRSSHRHDTTAGINFGALGGTGAAVSGIKHAVTIAVERATGGIDLDTLRSAGTFVLVVGNAVTVRIHDIATLRHRTGQATDGLPALAGTVGHDTATGVVEVRTEGHAAVRGSVCRTDTTERKAHSQAKRRQSCANILIQVHDR